MTCYLLKSAAVGVLGMITACVVVVIAQNRDDTRRERGSNGWAV